MSLKLSLDDTLRALNTNNKLDGINIVLGSSKELEEVLLTLTESFNFDGAMVSDIENIVKGQTVEMPFDFVKQIHKIKESRNGFSALMFCLKHFGFDQVNDALFKLFDMKPEPYAETLKKLDNFKRIHKGLKPKGEKKKPDLIVPRGSMVFQRIVLPIETSRRDQPLAIAIYTPGLKSEKHLSKVLGVGEELPINAYSRELGAWPAVPRGIYAAYSRKLRAEHDIETKKNGVERVITAYS